jgi:hypothetical protein
MSTLVDDKVHPHHARRADLVSLCQCNLDHILDSR